MIAAVGEAFLCFWATVSVHKLWGDFEACGSTWHGLSSGPYCAFMPTLVYALLGTSPHASISSGAIAVTASVALLGRPTSLEIGLAIPTRAHCQ